jgi:hypothetical protein
VENPKRNLNITVEFSAFDECFIARCGKLLSTHGDSETEALILLLEVVKDSLEEIQKDDDIWSVPSGWCVGDKHCTTCICGRRAPVQKSEKSKFDDKSRGPGTISWEEYLEAMSDYFLKYGTTQSAERLAQRGGLSYWELEDHLGHQPKTWQPIR